MRGLRAARVRRNQRQILSACQNNDRVFLKPDNRVEHFYHFLFDLSLPLWSLLDSAPNSVKFVIKPFGIFSERISQMFPGRVEFESDESQICKLPQMLLLGMNSRFVKPNSAVWQSFKRQVCLAFQIEPSAHPNQVLLIERMPPEPYFVHDAVKKGSGASRRSIPNHDELASALESIIHSPYQFQNVQLERILFEEQVRLFDNASLVIGQHGAGLANCLWMQPGSNVIELSHDSRLDHFRVLCRAMNHGHTLYQTTGSHVAIDVGGFIASCFGRDSLSSYFSMNAVTPAGTLSV